MKKSILFLLVLSTFVFLQSCEDGFGPVDKSENPDNLVAPEIPPAEMFTLPITVIDDMDPNFQDSDSRSGVYDNWLHAGLSLLGWNVVVVVNLAVPTTAISQAFNVDAQYIGNNTFEWAYDYQAPSNFGGQKYNISLTAEFINTTEIEWKLTASEVGGFDNFLWMSAVIANDHTYANYTLNRNPENPESYIGISYTKDFSIEAESLRFTNVIPADVNNGDYIEYRVDPTAAYNRAFDVVNSPTDILNIEWDQPSNIGRVKHPSHFGDDEWHCWDTNVMDVDCN